ncbi:uncharacterized protein LOC109141182 isoform X2 [Larimichthys crocea]|uniref:uncharacterized protein LOC109141182 isoform X2 n=1 Tax=Larimichthys crocea TaxID=215358 RepID=UPI000F5E928B|nr:uncharacterized protein LOC109141182 isoform X2 [Larimichthys crocea]
MFRLNQAPLLCVQLLVMGQVFAVIDQVDHMVYRGDSVSLDCNISKENTRQISWTKDRFLFAYFVSKNQTFSNFTSPRLRIDQNFPSVLNVSDAQHEDAGLYKCVVAGNDGSRTTQWNLTVSEKPEEVSSSWYFPYILAAVIGLLLCGIAPAVCLCRKKQTKTLNQDLVDGRTLSHVQYCVRREGGQVVPSQLQSCVEYRISHKKRESSRGDGVQINTYTPECH